ncbi:MAG TPA: aminotransferase class I/II-fold pyridoxal phosphate-dependent enzyme [Mucilaginibacter sp.]
MKITDFTNKLYAELLEELELYADLGALPLWMSVLKYNIKYFRHGLLSLGLNIGDTRSAIFPVRTGDKIRNAQICQALLQKGIYANQINYPAVSLKDARIRMGVTALHNRTHLDEALNVWVSIKKEFNL